MSLTAALHPAVQRWFQDRLGEPTPPQREGWPPIRAGRNTLIAAPTGSGKTLAAFLSAIDALDPAGRRPARRDAGPLRLAAARALQRRPEEPAGAARGDPRRWTRPCPRSASSCAPATRRRRERAAMSRRPPHILVTTPESLYLLLTSDGGRRMLRTVSTVIVDEIHALVRDKRGSHLALSLERLEAPRRAGRSSASASRRRRSRWTRWDGSSSAPGARARSSTPGRSATLDLGIEVPPSPLSTVCSHEQWEEIYARMAELVREHRTTLVFVNTRKMAERIAAQLDAAPRRGRGRRATTAASRRRAGSTPSSG